MKIFIWAVDLFYMAYKGYEEMWWELYGWYETIVLARPEEYRRKTYGESWRYFKKAGLRLGDLAVLHDGREALVVGIVKQNLPNIAPIDFRCIGEAYESARLHESYLEPGKIKVLRHLPFQAMIQFKRRFEIATAIPINLAAGEIPSFK